MISYKYLPAINQMTDFNSHIKYFSRIEIAFNLDDEIKVFDLRGVY